MKRRKFTSRTWRLCILGGLHPEELVALGDLTSDGLLQRGLPCLMAPAKRGDQYFSVERRNPHMTSYIRSINAARREKYLFATDALEVRDRVNDTLFEARAARWVFGSALIGAIGKLNGYFARICLVLEVARQHDPAACRSSGPESRKRTHA